MRLSWQPPADTSVAGYNLYRARDTFEVPAEASRLNTELISTPAFDDLPAAEGPWHYRVATVDIAGNESLLSNEAVADSDGTAPRAVSIEYNTSGPYDPADGRMAPATVTVLLTVNEPLQGTPYLSIAPEGGMPLAVELSRETDISYTGFFVIPGDAPDGTAYAIFSGRDQAGNRGTEIDAGASIQIDTHGPAVNRLIVDPSTPIRNDAQTPVSIAATVGLSEPLKPGTLPRLSYLLSGEERSSIDIEQLTQLAVFPGDAQTWQARFTLPADAGLDEAETLQFIFQATDDLDNSGDRILADNLFQVYQGELPPLATPHDLTATALPKGRIQLAWTAVDAAAGYQLYRQAPAENGLSAYQRIDAGEAYMDFTEVDGTHTYAIASIRAENGQETLSSQSAPATAVSDSLPPEAPRNLVLDLASNGIKAEWSSAAVYRSGDIFIVSCGCIRDSFGSGNGTAGRRHYSNPGGGSHTVPGRTLLYRDGGGCGGQ